tara:strand:- start:955 stop:1083 length:129 start_codon:yes stop_codon:yes gene_type:complete
MIIRFICLLFFLKKKDNNKKIKIGKKQKGKKGKFCPETRKSL